MGALMNKTFKEEPPNVTVVLRAHVSLKTPDTKRVKVLVWVDIVGKVDKLQQIIHACQVVNTEVRRSWRADADDGTHALGTSIATRLACKCGCGGAAVFVTTVETELNESGGFLVVLVGAVVLVRAVRVVVSGCPDPGRGERPRLVARIGKAAVSGGRDVRGSRERTGSGHLNVINRGGKDAEGGGDLGRRA